MLQTILFPKSKFKMSDALHWILAHGYTAYKVDVTNRFLRFRQREPPSHASYYTVTLPNGIELVHSK